MLYFISIFLFTKCDHLSKTQQPFSQISQVIHHKKAEWISFEKSINVEVSLQYSFRN